MSEERLREARTLLVRFILNELVTTEEKRARLHSAAATLYEAASTVRSPLPDAAPSRDAGLDAAWAAAEAALPEGWRMLVGREVNRPYSYWATASEDRHDPDTHAYTIVSTSHDGTLKLTAADAIRELIALLDARLAADGAPFPAGVNRADSEGER